MIWINNIACGALPGNDFGWVTRDGGVVWDVFDYHGACPNRDIISYGYILHQEHTGPEVYVIPYMSSLVMIGPDITLMTDIEVIPDYRARSHSYTHEMRNIKSITNSGMPIGNYSGTAVQATLPSM